MEINKAGLNEKLVKYQQVIMYGCGKIAKETYGVLQEYGNTPVYCTVTERKPREDLFEGKIPIVEFGELAEANIEYLKSENVIILIAVSEKFEKEIEMKIQGYGIQNYLFISDYDRKSEKHAAFYHQRNRRKYMEEITQWYIDNMGNPNMNTSQELEKLEQVILSYGTLYDPQKIIFVAGAFTQRSFKIAKALLDIGYKVKIFIEPDGVVLGICEDGLKRLGVTYTKCELVEELMYRIIMEKGSVVHLFTRRRNAGIDRVLIRMKELFPPIVYDEYDIINEMYTKTSHPGYMFENERYCLEHTDAICNRGYEIDYLKKQGYQIDAKVIQFHDYCSDEQCEYAADDESLSLCYVGGLPAKEKYFASYAKGYFEFADLCKKNECHFHIYPNVWNEDAWSEYIALEKENEFFHLHEPVAFEQLKYEISKYDYGVFPLNKENAEQGMGVYKKEKNIYGTANKYFDYMDAGLPFIAAAPRKLIAFFEEKGVSIHWAIEDFDFDILRKRKKELREQVLRVRKELQMKNHVGDLLKLYGSLK